jgi:hypothetical protein
MAALVEQQTPADSRESANFLKAGVLRVAQDTLRGL